MSIFNKYGPCRGITLWKRGLKRVELWIIPANYEIVEHSHPHENVELMYLFGDATFYRRNPGQGAQEFKPRWFKDFGRCFTVSWYHTHWFSVSKWPLVFINFQSFVKGFKVESAAKDFRVFTDKI